MLSRFFKGVFKERAIKPKYSTTWDTQPVLSFLKKLQPWKNLKANEISEKIATLLALVTARRLQTLALIIIGNITVTTSNVQIKIPDSIKTSKPGSFQPNLILPFFNERPNICVAQALIDY